MCGIAGILNFSARPDLEASLRRMANAMRYRGPDDEGFALFPAHDGSPQILSGPDTPDDMLDSGFPFSAPRKMPEQAYGDFRLGLAHRRLSIIDLSSSGRQPMCTPDRRWWIVFNGEIYNAAELRSELEAEGEFFGSSDTEVLLRALERWGEACLDRLNGMWAFALWDTRERRLLLSRDRLGIKPLYYYRSNDSFVFASEIKAIIASNMYAPEPDWENVYHNFSFRFAPRPGTCFKDVVAVPPGAILSLDMDGGHSIRRYWDIPSGVIDEGPGLDEWSKRIESVLQASIRRRLIADVPIGAFMSGGIDSTTVAAMAGREQGGFTAFTLGFESGSSHMDEVAQAREAAVMNGLNHIVETVDPAQVLACIPDMIRCYEEPFYTLAPNYVISRLAAANGMKVVLNGLGGDELFCGYGRDRIMKEWRHAHSVSGWLRRLFGRGKDAVRLRKLASLKNETDVYVHAFSIFPREWKDALFKAPGRGWPSSPERFRDIWQLDGRAFSDPFDALMFHELAAYIGGHHLHRVDQFTMRFSLEGRFPFLDHELVELAAQIPIRFKVRNGQGKYVLRNMARRYIPESCLRMKKLGFGLPVEDWMRRQLRPLVDASVNSLKARDVLDAHEIDATVKEFDRGRAHYRLWLLVSLELWLQEFFEGGIRPFPLWEGSA